MHSSIIESLGSYLPKKCMLSKEISNRLQYNDLWTQNALPLEKITGIKKRHIASKDETSYDLAKKAVINCLKNSNYKPKEIDIVISCNISKVDHKNHFQLAPSYSIQLKKELGFTKAIAFDINNACAGSFTGINILDSFIKTGRFNNGIIVSGEYISHLTETALKEISEQTDDRLACLTLGDAGVACILERGTTQNEGFIDNNIFTEKGSLYCTAKPSGSPHGGAIMHTKSKEIFETTCFNSAISIKHLFNKNSLSFHHDIDHIIMHQVSNRGYQTFINNVNTHAGDEQITHDLLIKTVSDYGNTASTTHLLALDTFLKNGKIKANQTILFAIQASGSTSGSFLYKMKNNPLLHNNKANFKTKKESPFKRAKVKFKKIGLNQNASGIEQTLQAVEKSITNAVKSDINCMIYTGMLKPDFICEPAYATIVSEASALNKGVDFFCYDIANWGLGWLNACMILDQKTQIGEINLSMIVTSETQNESAQHDLKTKVIEASTSTLIGLSNDDSGFSHFSFYDFTEYHEGYSLALSCTGTKEFLIENETEGFIDNLLQCIKKAVNAFLTLNGIDLKEFNYVLAPQISNEFITSLSKTLNTNSVIELNIEGDLLSSSIPFGLEYLHQKASKYEKALIISFSPGIQVGLAIYTF